MSTNRRGTWTSTLLLAAVVMTTSGCSSEDSAAPADKAAAGDAAAKPDSAPAAQAAIDQPSNSAANTPSETVVDAEQAFDAIDFLNGFRYPVNGRASFTATVSNGEHEKNTDNPNFEFFSVNHVSFGDIGGDGVPEAAVTTFYAQGRGNPFLSDVFVFQLVGDEARLVGTVGETEAQKTRYLRGAFTAGGQLEVFSERGVTIGSPRLAASTLVELSGDALRVVDEHEHTIVRAGLDDKKRAIVLDAGTDTAIVKTSYSGDSLRFSGAAGQHVTISPWADFSRGATISIAMSRLGEGDPLLEVATGESSTAELPADGDYELQVRPLDDDQGYSHIFLFTMK